MCPDLTSRSLSPVVTTKVIRNLPQLGVKPRGLYPPPPTTATGLSAALANCIANQVHFWSVALQAANSDADILGCEHVNVSRASDLQFRGGILGKGVDYSQLHVYRWFEEIFLLLKAI